MGRKDGADALPVCLYLERGGTEVAVWQDVVGGIDNGLLDLTFQRKAEGALLVVLFIDEGDSEYAFFQRGSRREVVILLYFTEFSVLVCLHECEHLSVSREAAAQLVYDELSLSIPIRHCHPEGGCNAKALAYLTDTPGGAGACSLHVP